MSNIKALDFAKEVETNRQRLINHCKQNGVEINNNSSLDAVVTANNTINSTQTNYKVEFIDIDGTPIDTQYVEYGGSATLPTNPTYDSNYLEFSEWAVSGGDSLSNITRDTVAIPRYYTKYDSTLEQRPTYLFVEVVSTTEAIQITANYSSNSYILWGDGSSAETFGGTYVSHTYSTAGTYVITIYSTSGTYTISTNTAQIIYNNNINKWRLLKIYMGERYANNSILNIGNQQYYFKVITFSENYSYNGNSTTTARTVFGNNELDCLVLPKLMTYIGTEYFSYTMINHLILPPNLTKIYAQPSSTKASILNSYVLPNTVNDIVELIPIVGDPEGTFTIPSGVTTISGTSSMSLSVGKFNSNSIIPKVLNIPLVKSFSVPSTQTVSFTINARNMKELTLPSNFDISGCMLYIPQLSSTSLIDLANKLKDNTGLTAKTITFYYFTLSKLTSIYVDSNGDQVPSGTSGAVSLLEFIINKNWTVSFANHSY